MLTINHICMCSYGELLASYILKCIWQALDKIRCNLCIWCLKYLGYICNVGCSKNQKKKKQKKRIKNKKTTDGKKKKNESRFTVTSERLLLYVFCDIHICISQILFFIFTLQLSGDVFQLFNFTLKISYFSHHMFYFISAINSISTLFETNNIILQYY